MYSEKAKRSVRLFTIPYRFLFLSSTSLEWCSHLFYLSQVFFPLSRGLGVVFHSTVVYVSCLSVCVCVCVSIHPSTRAIHPSLLPVYHSIHPSLYNTCLHSSKRVTPLR
ncbi:uncharacterized protein BO97DRAFT_257936 [Aspergillus homomorphus CBS 101889]|uniref:Uncharacterized protein n=1 Tax=Aspergillus homomorphus (strain CBS 101889) TaxID=1450537 RepID=A0A395I3Q4_ASPHC|nr:hypothetical protein BO97DRAFT_257936 [Aspergillus homomorphus CBS 101889]RAL14832.1 hypothetical protein BO97DRAFT_257936 [Aspergillus homomorphus CBS 101889]